MNNFENIPQELKTVKNWIVYKSNKMPCYEDSKGNLTSDSWQRKENWATFDDAIKVYKKYNCKGIGFIPRYPYLIIDIDRCLDENGLLMYDFAKDITNSLKVFTEISMSGKGLHIYCKVSEHFKTCRRKFPELMPVGTPENQLPGLEIFSTSGYIACTGLAFTSTVGIPDTTGIVSNIIKTYWESNTLKGNEFKIKTVQNKSAVPTAKQGFGLMQTDNPCFKDIGVICLPKTPPVDAEECIDILRNHFDYTPMKLDSYEEMVNYLVTEISLDDFMEFAVGVSGKSFKCPFHNDGKSSAGITILNRGTNFFKCFACDAQGDIVDVMSRICSCSRGKAIDILCKGFNLTYEDSPAIKVIRENMRLLGSEIWEHVAKDSLRLINKNGLMFLVQTLLNIALENAYCCGSSDEVIFFCSRSQLKQKLGRKNDGSTQADIIMTVFLKLCSRVPDSEIPEKLLAKAKAIQAREKHRDLVQFYKFPAFCELQAKRSNDRALLWKEHNLTKKGLSREALFRIGEKVADECYPKRKGRQLSKEANKFQSDMEVILNTLIHENGYATENQLLDSMLGNLERNKVRLKRCLHESLMKYGYVRVRTNKQLKMQYNIQGKGFPYLMIREVQTGQKEG